MANTPYVDSSFVLRGANATLPGAFSLGSLGSGVLFSTVTSSVSTLSINGILTSLAGLMVASQDLIIGASSNTLTNFPKGSNGQFLGVVSGNLAWTTPSTGAPTSSQYILKTADASLPNAQSLGALSSGVLLNQRSGSTGTLGISTLLTNLDGVTVTSGDLLVGTGVNTMGALGISGAPSGYVLTSTGSGPSWQPAGTANLTARYWLSSATGATGLTNYVNLASTFSSDGLMKVTNSGGTASPNIASAGTDYYAPTYPLTLGGGSANARVFIGSGVGGSSSGTNLVYIGDGCGGATNSGSNITLVGTTAGYNNTAAAVTHIGSGAGGANTGTAIVTVGVVAGANNTGTNSVYIGNSCAQGANGDFNVTVGDGASATMDSSSDYNVHIGAGAASSRTNYQGTTFVGYGTQAASNSLVNAGAFGYGASVEASNTIQIGYQCGVSIGTPSATPTTSNAANMILYKDGSGLKVPMIAGSNVFSQGAIVLAKRGATCGSIRVPNGQDSVLVETTAVTTDSIILVTMGPCLSFTGDLPRYNVSGIDNLSGFYIQMDQNAVTPPGIWFYWQIINPS